MPSSSSRQTSLPLSFEAALDLLKNRGSFSSVDGFKENQYETHIQQLWVAFGEVEEEEEEEG